MAFLVMVYLLSRAGVCRSCAIKKLVKSKKRCWLLTGPACHEATLQIDQVTSRPFVKSRQKKLNVNLVFEPAGSI